MFVLVQARRAQLTREHSSLLPFAVHPYLRKGTGKQASDRNRKKAAYQKLENYESYVVNVANGLELKHLCLLSSREYLNANSPYVDPSWLNNYFRKKQRDKW